MVHIDHNDLLTKIDKDNIKDFIKLKRNVIYTYDEIQIVIDELVKKFGKGKLLATHMIKSHVHKEKDKFRFSIKQNKIDVLEKPKETESKEIEFKESVPAKKD